MAGRPATAGRHTGSASFASNVKSRRTPAVWMAGFAGAVLLLGYIVARDYPHLAQREEEFAQTFGGHFEPRFWAQECYCE